MVFERTDRGLKAWQVIFFLIVAIALGVFVYFVTTPHLNEILEANAVVAAEEVAEAPPTPAVEGSEAHVEEEEGPLVILDMHYLGYHAEDVPEVHDALVAGDGLGYYNGTHLVADLFFAVFFFFAAASLFLFLTNPARRFSLPLPEGVRLVVVALAFAGAIADFLENIVIWIVINSDAPPSSLVYLGGTLTGIKWLGYTAAAAAIIATVVLALLRGMGGGNSQPATPARRAAH
ncbi:MAG: hypothetical protein AB7U48_11435 [Bauldia sp.]